MFLSVVVVDALGAGWCTYACLLWWVIGLFCFLLTCHSFGD